MAAYLLVVLGYLVVLIQLLQVVVVSAVVAGGTAAASVFVIRLRVYIIWRTAGRKIKLMSDLKQA